MWQVKVRRMSVVLAGIAIGLFIGIMILLIPSGFYGIDLTTYLAAGERLNAGHPLYQLSPGDRPVFIDTDHWTTPLVSPPTIAVLWRPLAALGPLGSAIWWMASCLSVLTTIFLLWRRQPLLTSIAAIVLIMPITHAIAVANVNSMILLGLVLVWRAWVRRHDAQSGTIAGLMAVVKLTPMILVWWLLVTRRWRAFSFGSATIVILLLVGLVGAGVQAHLDYLAMVRNPGSIGIYPPSLAGIAVSLGVPASVATLLPWVFALSGVIAVLLLRDRPALAFGAAVLTMVFGSPTVTITWYALLLGLLAPIAYPQVASPVAGPKVEARALRPVDVTGVS